MLFRFKYSLRAIPRLGIRLSHRHLSKYSKSPFREALSALYESMIGSFSIRGTLEDFVKDVKFVTGPVSNYFDHVTPLRLDIGNGVTRFTKTHSDTEDGGNSYCSSQVVKEDAQGRVVLVTKETMSSDSSKTSEENTFVRFFGDLNFKTDMDAKIKTSGFCAAQAVCRKVLDLEEYSGIALVLRSKFARSYVFGMKTMSIAMLDDMQYQVK